MKTGKQSEDERNMTMKTHKKLILLATLAVFAVATASRAVEQTGRVIEKLVAEVDKQLSSLEDVTDKNTGEKERLKSVMDEQFAKYDKAQGDTERAQVRGEIVNVMAQLNAADRKEIVATEDVIVNVAETMGKLSGAIKGNPNFNPDTLKEQKEKLGKFVSNAARIVKTLDLGADQRAQGQSAALKNSLVMLNRQLSDPLTGTATAVARIEETKRTLEAVAVQLHILQGLLENERTMLLTSTHVQTVDLALLRLARAKLGADVVANIPNSKHNDVVDRIRRGSRPFSESGSSLMSSDANDTGAFDTIASEEFNKIQ
jgi:hypothetical protein